MHAGKSNSDFTYSVRDSELITATFEEALGIVTGSSAKTISSIILCKSKINHNTRNYHVEGRKTK